MHYRKFGEWTNTVASNVQLLPWEQFVGVSIIGANCKDFSVQIVSQNIWNNIWQQLFIEYPAKNYIDLSAVNETDLMAVVTSSEWMYLYWLLWTYISNGVTKEIYVTPNNLVGDAWLSSDADLVRIQHRDNKHYVTCNYWSVSWITANLPVYTNGTVFEVSNTNNISNHHFSVSALGKYARDWDYFYVRVSQWIEWVRCYGIDTTFEWIVSYPLEEGTIYWFQYQDKLNTYKLVHRHKY